MAIELWCNNQRPIRSFGNLLNALLGVFILVLVECLNHDSRDPREVINHGIPHGLTFEVEAVLGRSWVLANPVGRDELVHEHAHGGFLLPLGPEFRDTVFTSRR
jgi:hypothetical protein